MLKFKIIPLYCLLILLSPPTFAQQKNTCPGLADDLSSNLKVHKVCQENDPNCKPSNSKYTRKILISAKPLMGLSVTKAFVQDIFGHLNIIVEIDERSQCWFHQTTQENINKELAIVYKDEAMVVAKVAEAISDKEIHISVSHPEDTSEKVLSLCKEINPQCMFKKSETKPSEKPAPSRP